MTKEIKLEGKLVQFVYRNPHSFVHVVAPDDKGALQRWAVEWSGTTQLGSQGVNRETLKVGDEVVIFGASVPRPRRVPRPHAQPEAHERRLHLGQSGTGSRLNVDRM